MAGGTAFQPNAFQTTAFQIAGGVAATQFEATFTVLQDSDTVSLNVFSAALDVGAGNPPRRRRRILVEIDQQEFEVTSEEEAYALLDQAKKLAEEQAKTVIERAKKAVKRPTRKIVADARKSLSIPQIKTSDTILEAAKAISSQIEEIYRDALRTVEIQALLRKVDDETDDEEALLMLL